MAVWTGVLKANPTEWLLEADNPSVRYLTLKNILGKAENDPEVRRAKACIMDVGVVPRMLRKLTVGTSNDAGRFYRDKYKGAVWQLIILAEHEADGANRQIRTLCEYLLRCSQDPESFGFAYDPRAGGQGGRHGEVIPCLTGNMVWSLLKLGWASDERVRKGIEWITTYQRFDDGVATKPRGWPYDRYEHSCHLGVVKALKALSAVPTRYRNRAVKATARNGCEYLLSHHIYKRSHDLGKVSKPGWLRLQYPLMYQTDILEIAGILLDFGIKDSRMTEAIEKIVSKQNKKGQWNLNETFNGRFVVNIEKKGMPSKWITYRALHVLKRYFE
jgi:hypothetical protein